jgi:hypothetical protein
MSKDAQQDVRSCNRDHAIFGGVNQLRLDVGVEFGLDIIIDITILRNLYLLQ